jgi:hypothetical protein
MSIPTARSPLRPGFDPGGFLKQLTAILGGGGGGGGQSESDESSGFYDDGSEEDTSDDASMGQAPAGRPNPIPTAAAVPDALGGGATHDDGPHTDTDSDDAEFMEE